MTFSEVGSITLSSDPSIYSGVIDTGNKSWSGYAYFGSILYIVKIRLSDFTEVNKILTSQNVPWAAVIDVNNGYAYFGTQSTPPKVLKIDLSTFTEVSSITLTDNPGFTAVIDTTNGYAYFTGYTTPGKVIKIRLSDFTIVGSTTFASGEDKPQASVIDTTNGYAYFGTKPDTGPGKVIKIRLSDLTEISSITLTDIVCGAAIDTINGYAYFGLYYGNVVKIRLSDFSLVDTITISGNGLYAAVIDTSRRYLYFGTTYPTGTVTRIRLPDFKIIDSITIPEGTFNSAVIDITNGYSYLGMPSSGKIVKVDVLPCPRGLKYDEDTVTMQATPIGGVSPYHVEFRKNGIVLPGNDQSGRPYTIDGATEDITLTRTYMITDTDVRTSNQIQLSVYMSDSCPVTAQTCTDICTIYIGCSSPVCDFIIS